MNKEELEFLEREYTELYTNASRQKKHLYYARVGSVIGIIFIMVSLTFENEFYVFFGTLGMSILNGAAGMCILLTIIFSLPGSRADEKHKWDMIEEKRKELDKLRKKING